MQTFTCQKWGKWNFGSKPTNPPTHPTSITSNSIVTRCCCGLGVLATVKHWRHHDLSSVIRPRNRGHLHLNLRTQRCWRRLRLAWWLPGGGLTASSCFFFGGGGLRLNWRLRVFWGFLVEGSFRFRVFCRFDVDGESPNLSRLFWLVLKNSWMKPIELKFKKTKVTKIEEKIVQRNVLCVPQTCRGICHRRGSRDAKGLPDLRKHGWLPGQNWIQKSSSKQMWVSCGLWCLCLPTDET